MILGLAQDVGLQATSVLAAGGRGGGGGRGRVCLCACAARVGVRVCGCVLPDAGVYEWGFAECAKSGTRQTPSLPGVRSEALGKFSFFFSFFLFLLFYNIFFKLLF